MSVRLKSSKASVWLGLGLGMLIALPALFVATISGGAGHGEYVAARVLFPTSMLLTLVEGKIGAIATALGLLQFPIYGAVVGWCIAIRNGLPAALLLVTHVVAAAACFAGLLPNFS